MWSRRRTRVFSFSSFRLYSVICARCSNPCPETVGWTKLISPPQSKGHFPLQTKSVIRELLRISPTDVSWPPTSVNSWLPNWVLTFRESNDFLFFFLFLLFIYFIYLFLAVLGLCCCARAFSSWRWAGATLHCGVQTSHCSGFSCCGAWALGARASVVVAHMLHSCGSRALERRLSSCGTWA